MQSNDFYDTAHLFVAAIRVLTHRNGVPPSIESVSEMVSLSKESGHHVCRKLSEKGIVEVVEGAFGTKLFVRDHLAIEEIPRGEQASRLDEALKSFQDSKKELSKKIETIQSQQQEKKKKLFAELEKQLKKGKK